MVKRNDLERGFDQQWLNELINCYVKINQGVDSEKKQIYKIFKIIGFKEYDNLKAYQFSN